MSGICLCRRWRWKWRREERWLRLKSDFDSNWLPNFGRVWQLGTWKESRKEFDIEKQKRSKAISHTEIPMKIQPCISKKMVSIASPFAY